MKTVLVLCEGNICRSPMAEGLFRAVAPELRVSSAGLGALVGRPADPVALRLMAEHGIDISGHRATQVSRPLCLQADLILVMEQVQRKRLEQLYPEVCGRVYRLGEEERANIADPYRKAEDAFRLALTDIAEGVTAWTRKLKQL